MFVVLDHPHPWASLGKLKKSPGRNRPLWAMIGRSCSGAVARHAREVIFVYVVDSGQSGWDKNSLHTVVS